MRSEITSLIQPHSKILDLGCGNGDLLSLLTTTKNCYCYGIDIDYNNIIECTEKGISVFQGNIDDGLSGFANQVYDVVILSQTLQQVQRPLFVIEEMLRVGKMAIVTFPNFAHWQTRYQLCMGQIPQTRSLPYPWYDTPNIRVISIAGFRQMCHNEGFKIIKENHISPVSFASNLLARRGVFLIQKES